MDLNFFYEDGAQGAELRQPLAAHALKSVVVEGSLRLQVLLEKSAAAPTEQGQGQGRLRRPSGAA